VCSVDLVKYCLRLLFRLSSLLLYALTFFFQVMRFCNFVEYECSSKLSVCLLKFRVISEIYSYCSPI